MMPLVIFQHSFVKMALLPSRIFFLELIPRDTLLRTTQNTTITKNLVMNVNLCIPAMLQLYSSLQRIKSEERDSIG